ncbi:MAG TPA: molybdenum cofactor biosynthesis protein MoaE [Acidobacteriaceae bacterium]|jgi:molybdopterin synthase catalytic subunit|nr:molybdenum cofactor biosynthesis protein MoaE [Acidobacteriaceae bacterium]
MRVTLLAFGVLRDQLGATSALELAAGSTVGDLVKTCRARAPEKGGLWASIAVAVNQEYASSSQALADGDEVALLPPVSGGAGRGKAAPKAASRIALVQERIDTSALAESLKRGEDGAVVVFDGVVRNNSRGRKTRYLFYEAYEAMALGQMEQLATKALADYPVREVAIVHRLGRLEIGESSVAIAVASAHRAAAFDACRWLIDTLKQSVPIWKKEFFEDGAVWAQGDPFPAALGLEARGKKAAAPKRSSGRERKR